MMPTMTTLMSRMMTTMMMSIGNKIVTMLRQRHPTAVVSSFLWALVQLVPCHSEIRIPFFGGEDLPPPPPPQSSTAAMWLASLSPPVSLSIGIVLTVVGSGFMAIGSIVMKIGIQEVTRKANAGSWAVTQQQHSSISVFTSATWWMGLSVYAFGALLHVAGLAFAPASVLAPLNSVGLVANAAAAVVLLGEQMRAKEVCCTAMTVVGVALCSLTSFLQSDDSLTVDGTDSWRDPLYLLYFTACSASLFGCLLAVNTLETRFHDAQVEALFQAHMQTASRIEMAAATTASQQFIPPELPPRRIAARSAPFFVGLLYSVASGIIGAQFVLQLKELTVLLPETELWRQSPQPYACLSFCVAAVLLQMHFLNLGLGRAEATVVVPAYYVAWTLFGTVGGCAKFHEMFGFTSGQVMLFLLGLLLTLLSIVLLATVSAERSDAEARPAIDLGLPLLALRPRVHLSTAPQNGAARASGDRLTRSFTAADPEREYEDGTQNWTFHGPAKFFAAREGVYSPVAPSSTTWTPGELNSHHARRKPKSLAVITYEG